MPPTDRFVISFAAEPPQEGLPYGRWADTLREHFMAAVREIDSEGEELGEAGEIAWFPDRTYGGRTYVPAVARTSEGYELFGYVSFTEHGGGPADFEASADFTSETGRGQPRLEARPLRRGDRHLARARRASGRQMTLVWGVPMVPGGATVTAELANLAVDQCELVDERFTLMAARQLPRRLPGGQALGQARRGARHRVALRRRRRQRIGFGRARPEPRRRCPRQA